MLFIRLFVIFLISYFSYGIVSIEYRPVVHEDVLLVQEYNDTTWFVPF